jgi:hypothetical protein
MSVLPIYLRMTNSIERSASWDADSRSAHEEIPCLLWNARVHYDVHKSPPLVPILSHMNSSTPTYPISLRLVLMASLTNTYVSGVFCSI